MMGILKKNSGESVDHAIVTMKYKKKLRLLVTNRCSQNCSYCHNEGMAKWPFVHLDPGKLEPFLPEIKKYTNRVVLSGGEPFEYEHLPELVELLSGYGFDLSLISAKIDKERLSRVAYGLKTLHYSLHGLNSLEAGGRVIRWLNDEYPNIRLSLNVPFDRVEPLRENWEALYGLAKDTGANLQLIRIFTCGQNPSAGWEQRWREMEAFLAPRARFLEATEREVRYLTEDLIKIDLLDIPCRSSGPDFGDGACLYNSDLTIDPELRLSLCRWTDSAVPLYEGEQPLEWDAVVRKATETGRRNCVYGAIGGGLQEAPADYWNQPHYSWPRLDRHVFARIEAGDLSYYGKSGSVALLENEFSRFLGVRYTLAVNAGTTAVYLACMALDLSPGDEIVIPAATFPTLVSALLCAGVRVRLCDIDPVTGNVSLDSLRAQMGPRVKAVLVTHLWGLPVDMEAVREICRPCGAYILEDCSHAYGAEYQGRKVGTFGDIACFSMQANKAVYAGEGGLLVTSNRRFYERAVTLSSSVQRIFDCVKEPDYLQYWGTGLGLKLKLNPLGAPLALDALRQLEEVNQKRRRRALILEKAAEDSGIFVLPPLCDASCRRVYYTYKLVLREPYVPYRDVLLRALIHQGLEACTTSFIPAYEHALSAGPGVLNGGESFPGAETYYSRILSLPAFVHEPVELAEHYGAVIRASAKMVLENHGIS